MWQQLGCPEHPNAPLLTLDGTGAVPAIARSTLQCPRCARRWRQHDGIFDFIDPQALHGTYYEAECRQWDEHAERYEEFRTKDEVYLASLDSAAAALNPQPGELILDAGCGTGLFNERHHRPGVQAVGLDLSMTSLRYYRRTGRPYLALVRASLMALPFPDRTFDKVLCANVIQHVPSEAERLRCLAELARVTRANGRIVVSAHCYSWVKRRRGYAKEGSARTRSGAVQYVIRFRPGEFRRLLESKLAVEHLAGGGFPLPYRFKLSPVSRAVERCCRRIPAVAGWANMLVAVCRPSPAARR